MQNAGTPKSSPNTLSLDVPLPGPLTEELVAFWKGIFGQLDGDLAQVMLGSEVHHNRTTVYIERCGERLGGTCSLFVPGNNRILGGVGEVATSPEYRGKGIATRLCGMAVERFRSSGGQALFLGTGNPAAARIYYRCGWRKLAGANVMVNITSKESPEAFLVDYFRKSGLVIICEGTPADRIPMIPLIVTPHDWQVLDANAGIYSTRYRAQHSCMGLYPKYETLQKDGLGTWFSARAGNGQTVGMATARLDGSGGCRVDGFTHRYYTDLWNGLLEEALGWARARNATHIHALVSTEDEEKQALFEQLGMRKSSEAGKFDLDGRPVAAIQMEM